MAESQEQKQQRELDELKGKNIAHYSVMLAAYINSRLDVNKAIFALSTSGIGLLIAIMGKLQNINIWAKIFYVSALVVFCVAACSTLFIHAQNTKTIKSYIRNEGKEKTEENKLNTWKYANYFLFAIGLILSLLFTIVAIFKITKN